MSKALESFNRIVAERERRAKEPLVVYRPTAQQERIHTSPAHELIVFGGKRSGKSTATAIEFVSRILGVPLHDADGDAIRPRFLPPSPKDTGLFWIIGWDWIHVGQTIHRLLFQPGMGGVFRVIRDKHTGQWRSFNAADKFDLARIDESELAPPLIPARYCRNWFYKHEGAKQFHSVEIWDGPDFLATICAYPSSGENPKQGDAVSGIWIDEDIQNADFIKEWQDRLADKVGWFLWSVWPHDMNLALSDLKDRADEVAGEDNPQIEAVQLLMTQNDFLPAEGKRQSLERMGSDDEVARRDRGEFMIDALIMYDFVPAIHLVDTWREFDPTAKPTNIYELLRRILARSSRLPAEWTRYLAIDPSHTRTAVLSAVVPPPEFAGMALEPQLIIEWEVVAKKTSNEKLAGLLKERTAGLQYESFVIDQNAGRQQHAGRDDKTAQHYEQAFHRAGLRSRQTQAGFIYGCNQPPLRYRAVRHMMQQRDSGWPQLMLLEAMTTETQREFRQYKKKQQVNKDGSKIILDEPYNPKAMDCMAALEYLCEYLDGRFAAGTAYVPPENYSRGGSPAYHAAMALLKKQRQTEGDYVHLGPGAAA